MDETQDEHRGKKKGRVILITTADDEDEDAAHIQ